METKVLFLRGLQADYNAIQNKDFHTFYYCTDSGKLYLGSELLNNSGDLLAAVSRIAVNEGDIAVIKNAIQTIQGESNVSGSIKNIVATEIAKIVAGADASLDTLKEIADWITSHAQSAAQLSSDVNNMKTLLGSSLPDGAESSTVIGYIGEAVERGKYDPADVNRSTKCLIIPYCAYKNGQLASADFPVALAVEARAFDSCLQMTAMEIPLVRTIGEKAFYNCINLVAINIPAVTFVGEDAFALCGSAASLNAPLLRQISDGAFQNTQIVAIDLPACEIIGDSVFSGNSACEEVNIPICREIGSGAFSNVNNLESITLNRVEKIGSSAFNNCVKLNEVVITTMYVPQVGADIFLNTPMDTPTNGEYGTIYVRGELISYFKNAPGWSQYAERFAPISGTEALLSLPSVTVDDNGKVLKVINGIWDKGEDLPQWQNF